MAIPNFYPPFNLQNSTKYATRPQPTKYAKGDLRNWRFEQSEGVRPAEYYAPYKFLPVQLQDTETEDYVIIPKGRIVSALSTEDSTPLSGLVYPSSSGQIPVGFAATEAGGALIRAYIDDSYFGYSDGIAGLIVPCNGGVAYSGFYTSSDVTALTMTTSGSLATASGYFSLPANCPIGVAYHDWYQDIRGKYLNYEMHADGGHVLTDWYIEVPYVKTAGTMTGQYPQYTNFDYANLLKWYTVNKQYTYLTVASGETFKNGMLLQSDYIGNYKLQQVQSLVISGASAAGYTVYNQPWNAQTVGKILAIDNRMPKGSLEDVLTYPNSGMPGSQTAGMIKVLFDFAYDCMTIGLEAAPTVEAVYNAIRAGDFGLARIQLHVS